MTGNELKSLIQAVADTLYQNILPYLNSLDIHNQLDAIILDSFPVAVGNSAYQIAQNNGFVGSESEWLASLVGADGLQGSNGADGSIGPVGPQGPSGYLGTMIIQHTTASGVGGGATVVGVNVRPLNTVVYNDIIGASLSSNRITLPSGKYLIRFSQSVYSTSYVQSYLVNVTSSVTKKGKISYSGTASVVTDTEITTFEDISSPSTFEFRAYVSVANSNGLGFGKSGELGVFASVEIIKVA